MKTTRDRFPVPWILPWATGRLYTTPHIGTMSSQATADTLFHATPLFVPNSAGVTAVSIGVELTIVGGAGDSVRMSLYTDERGRPGELIVGGLVSDLSTPAAPNYKAATISQYLRQGWYWMATSYSSAATGSVRAWLSNTHFSLLSREDEGNLDNNPFGWAVSPTATALVEWTANGHPEVFPWWNSDGPVHTTGMARVLIGI
jgi:hypothetical protein